MKSLITLILTSLFFIQAYGQRNYQDVVYLEDGSIIRGIIVEQVPGQSLKIETADGSVFFYQLDVVEKITKEPKPRMFNEYKAIEGNDFAAHIQTGASVFLGDARGLQTFSFSALFGARIKNVVSIGLKTGVEAGESRSVLVPVGLGIRANIRPRSRICPYVDFSGGYAYNNFVTSATVTNFNVFFDENPHGAFLNPTLGIKYWISNKGALSLSAGYQGFIIPVDNGNTKLHSAQFTIGAEF